LRTVDLSNIRFLVYDPNTHSRHLILNVLRALKAQSPRDTSTLKDALRNIETSPPDIFIMNWWRDHEGEEKLIKSIRSSSDDKIRFMPIIASSSSSTSTSVGMARNVGINEYLLKPFSPKSLYRRLAAVIKRPRNFVQVGDYFGPDRRRRQTELDDQQDRRKDGKQGSPIKPPDVRTRRDFMSQSEINKMVNPDHNPEDEGDDAA